MSKHAPIDHEADFEEIRARLQAEVDRRDGGVSGQSADSFSLRRDEAERLWSVSAERPFLYRPGAWGRARGLLLAPPKSFLRKLVRWYVEPLAYDQRRFNAAALKLVDALSERGDAGQAAVEQTLNGLADELRQRIDAVSAHARLAVELEERLTRLERRERRATGQPVRAASGAAEQVAFPDYFAF